MRARLALGGRALSLPATPPVDEGWTMVQSKSAGDESPVIGGLRCSICGTLFVPDGRRGSELCRACHLYALLRERYHKDPRRLQIS